MFQKCFHTFANISKVVGGLPMSFICSGRCPYRRPQPKTSGCLMQVFRQKHRKDKLEDILQRWIFMVYTYIYPEYALLKRFNNDRQFQHGGLISIYIEIFPGFPIETGVHFLLYFSTELCCIFQHDSVLKPFQLGSSNAFFCSSLLALLLVKLYTKLYTSCQGFRPFCRTWPFSGQPFLRAAFSKAFPNVNHFLYLAMKNQLLGSSGEELTCISKWPYWPPGRGQCHSGRNEQGLIGGPPLFHQHNRSKI